jgi:hypothetical protein
MVTKQTGKIEGFFWIGIGIIICALAWKVDLGSFREPGSGFVAFIAGLFFSVLGLVMVLSRIYSKVSMKAGPVSGQTFRGAPVLLLLFTVGVLLGYGLFLEILGYNVTTFLVMWALFYLFYEKGKGRVVFSFLVSIATTGVTYLVFEVWLRSQLPHGIFPWW